METGEDGVGKVVRRESAVCWIVESNVGGNVGYMGLGIGGGRMSLFDNTEMASYAN